MKSVEEKVLLFIAAEKLISKNDKILVGFSGGADSVFLLSFLNKFQKKFNLSLLAVHLNHNLRGKEADADESFCRKFCADLNTQIVIKKKNVKAFAQKNKLSLEEAGREIRYKLFADVAKKENCTKIATAHHQSDNTETVLLNLIKGSGLNGASGIPAKRGNLIRPLLGITKDEILSYLKNKKILSQIDSSNEQNDFQRNYLRNKIVKNLKEEINPKLDEKIFNFSSAVKDVLRFVDSILEESFKLIQFDKKGDCKIPLSLFETKHLFLQKAIIAHALGKVVEVNAHSIEGVLGLLNKKTGATFQLSGNLIALRDRSFISIKKKQTEIDKEIFIEKDGTKSVAGTTIIIKEVSKKSLVFSSEPGVEYLSADNLSFPLSIRKWKNADSFYPFGHSKPKRVSKFLTDLKLTTEEKENQLLLLNKSEVVWVIKRRLDNRYAITKDTKKIIKVRCK
ncbi:MAG: tRNA lysidine(34) synthetase TilS [Ignavibacteria bacterium]|nr:tRNA lysidine(34) synthetase TilS [Ignavibacteria bacterium]